MNIWQRSYTPSFSNRARSQRFILPIGAGVFLISFALALLLGSTKIDLFSAIREIASGEPEVSGRILLYVRLPRAAAAALAGSALAVSGVIIQAVLCNAMASPSIIGVNAGAGFGVSLFTALMPAAVSLIPLAAFIGAALTCLIIYLIAVKTRASRITITLTGIAVSSLLTACMSAVKALFPDTAYNLSSFSVGGLSGISINSLWIAGAAIILCLLLTVLLAGKIDILSLGEDTAHGLGMNVKRTRLSLLLLAGALAGSAVSFAGLLGFIGLVIPHIVRRFTGNRHKLLVPASALFGAVFVLLCDTASRILFAPYEIPVGIILSLVGAPFFITLILRSGKKRNYDQY